MARKHYTQATKGVIYFVEAIGPGTIKIGFTVNLKQRMQRLEAMSPVPLRLLKYIRGPFAIERLLLALFMRFRLHQEWHTNNKALRDFIGRLKEGEEMSPEDLLKK